MIFISKFKQHSQNIIGSGTDMIKHHFYRIPFDIIFMFGPRQLALSVEIGNQISLCWEPTGIEMNLLQVHVHSTNDKQQRTF
ncbi:hypothetical protein ACVPOY_06650 [Staphylococcus aureus]